jgi:hypothetical protein
MLQITSIQPRRDFFMRPTQSVFSGALIAALTLLPLATAQANGAGKNGRSGLQGPNCSAAGCHDNGAETAPTLAITGLENNLQMGSPVAVTLTVTTNNGTPEDRRAGFNAAISGEIGTLTASGTATQNLAALPNEVTHDGKQPYDNGSVSFTFDLLATTPGVHTLYAFANDANFNNARTGDTPGGTAVTFSVEDENGVVPQPPDAGPPPEAGDSPDAGPAADAGTTPDDAGTTADAGSGNGDANGGGNGSDNGGGDDAPGCGSRTVQSNVPWPAILAGFLLLLTLKRRRP